MLRRVLRAKGMEYPKDYNLINVGGSAQAFLSLTSGRIDAAIIAVPLNYEAAQMGYPVIAKVVDFIPNYQLTDVTVKRSWAEKNRPLLVRFMKGLVLAMRSMHDNKEADHRVSLEGDETQARSRRGAAGNITRKTKSGIPTVSPTWRASAR
mgnify:CR=1 FL=1